MASWILSAEEQMKKTAGMFVDTAVQYRASTSRRIKAAAVQIRQTMRHDAFKQGLDNEYRILTGSHFEALPFEVCGDRDMMTMRNDFPVVGKDLNLRHNQEDPAYLKLVLKDVDKSNITEAYHQCFVMLRGEECFSSGEFIRVVSGLYGDPSGLPHGPAKIVPAVKGHPFFGPQDTVYCLLVNQWPDIAKGFLSRHRSHDWPLKSTLDKIRNLPCFAVPVGRKTGEEKDIGWRISFSTAERELVFNMSDIMAGCLFALKGVKKVQWGEEMVGLCSYFIKTACFWVSEQQNTEGKDVMETAELVLDFLINAYTKKSLDHFFLINQNLLSQTADEDIQEALEILQMLRDQLRPQVMHSMSILIPEAKDMFKKAWALAKLPKKGIFSDSCHLQLMTDPKYEDSLKKAMENERPGTERFIFKRRVEYNFWTSNNAILYVIFGKKLDALEPDVIFTGLCKHFESVMEEVKQIHIAAYVNTYGSSLRRDYGEFFFAVSLYLQTKSALCESQDDKIKYQDYAEKSKKRAEELLKNSLDLIFPDEYFDQQICGLVALANFYHLSKDQENFSLTLEKLEPVLLNVNPGHLKYLTNETVIMDQDLSINMWKPDNAMFEKLVYKAPEHYLNIHCVSLGYYLLGVGAGSNPEKLDTYIENMTQLEPYFHRPDFKRPNKALISCLMDFKANICTN